MWLLPLCESRADDVGAEPAPKGGCGVGGWLSGPGVRTVHHSIEAWLAAAAAPSLAGFAPNGMGLPGFPLCAERC